MAALINGGECSNLPVEVVREFDGMHSRAHQAFVDAFGEHKIPMTNRFMRAGVGITQRHVDIELTEESRAFPIRDFDDRVLRPAAAILAKQTPCGQSFVPLELPSGYYQSGRHGDDFITIRVIAGWRPNLILDNEGLVVGYGEPTPILRLDVMTTVNLLETI